MAPHSSTRNVFISAAPVPKIQNKKISVTEYVTKYTEYLVLGYKQDYALRLLLEVVCPFNVFNECRTQQVLKKHCFGKIEIQYAAILLNQKIDGLREKEQVRSQKQIEKSREENDIYRMEVVHDRQRQASVMDQKTINKMFSDAIRSVSQGK